MNKMTLTHGFTKGLHLFVIAVLLAVALGILPVLVAHAGKLWKLTVPRAGTGTGTVTNDPVGVDDCGPDCQYYNEAVPPVEVTLTATPNAGSSLVGWGGDCAGTGLTTTVTMDDDKTCTATFDLAQPVGGIVVPVNKLGLLAPWMGLAALAGLEALGVVLVRRRRG